MAFLRCDVCNVELANSRIGKEMHMRKQHGVSGWLAQPEYKPMPLATKAEITERAEAKFKGFIIGEESNRIIPQRPAQMTDEEIIMSINRLADEFITTVKELNKALGLGDTNV